MGIGDVSKEEVLQYLELRDNDKELTAQIYKLVSGRIIHFKYMAEKPRETAHFEGMCTACYAGNG